MGKKNNWDAESMRDSLITDMKQEVENGGTVELPASSPAGEPTGTVAQPAESEAVQPALVEPTKGVQTDIPMSHYQRLYNQKTTREWLNKQKRMKTGVKEPKVTIGSLMLEAIMLWLDVQEGKATVEYKTEQPSSADGQQEPDAAKVTETITLDTNEPVAK